MISAEREAEVLRLYHAEKWRIGTIAMQLGLHHSTVRRVLAQNGVPEAKRTSRRSIVDPYLPFIGATLEKYPRLPASRLYAMVRERGYPGQQDHFRSIIARLRPRRPAEAFLRLKTLPGEQAQVDWGHFGKLGVGRAMRPLMAFVMVLSWSRMIFLRFYLGARMPSFVRGHVDAFAYFRGVGRVLLYDNLKSAVLERNGEAIRFHPKLLEVASHYRFEPRPVAQYRGNEKDASSGRFAMYAAASSPPENSTDSTTSTPRPTRGQLGLRPNAVGPTTLRAPLLTYFRRSVRDSSLCRTNPLRRTRSSKSTSARHRTCALISTTIRCRTPTCGRP